MWLTKPHRYRERPACGSQDKTKYSLHMPTSGALLVALGINISRVKKGVISNEPRWECAQG